MRIKFIQRLIDRLRNKKPLDSELAIKNVGDNLIEYDKNDEKYFQFIIVGQNNKIRIKKLANNNKGKLIIELYCDDNEITIDENLYIGTQLYISLGQNLPSYGEISNSKFIIGKNCRIEQAVSTQFNSNTKTIIGDNCLISLKVILYNTDAHPIYDKNTNQITNRIDSIVIGNNCWIGYHVTILKNVHLNNNTIVGFGAVVSKSFDEENIAIAGNPAKVVKRNIYYEMQDKEYIKNKIQEEIHV